MNIIRIPALQDNYIWLIYNYKNECIIIDPGESTVIIKILKKFKLILTAILLTHHHNDHTAGIDLLMRYFPKINVYGPKETEKYGTNILVSEPDKLTLLKNTFTVLNLPGHTKNHIGFYKKPWLFCGDSVFSAGCGKIYPGLTQEMCQTFLKIKKFPYNTLIFCGHEYTLSNINFVTSIFPQNKTIINYRAKIVKLRNKNKSTIPTKLILELKINPFFHCTNTIVKKILNIDLSVKEEWKTFQELRKKKDLFNEQKYQIK